MLKSLLQRVYWPKLETETSCTRSSAASRCFQLPSFVYIYIYITWLFVSINLVQSQYQVCRPTKRWWIPFRTKTFVSYPKRLRLLFSGNWELFRSDTQSLPTETHQSLSSATEDKKSWSCTTTRRSQWPRGLRRRSPVSRLQGLWVRIPPVPWMSVPRVLHVIR